MADAAESAATASAGCSQACGGLREGGGDDKGEFFMTGIPECSMEQAGVR
jgi:hypothetical protein